MSLLLRLWFAATGGAIYYGQPTFVFGDSFSYTESFLNLLRFGHYTFDPSVPDASLYRGPVYPFFWGAHYLLFGPEHVDRAVAVTQAMVDLMTGVFLALIVLNLSKSFRAAASAFLLFSIFPTNLIYIPITGTETLATSLTALTLLLAVTTTTTRQSGILGFLCGITVLTRQYLGLLLPVSLMIVLLRSRYLKNALLKCGAVVIGFGIVVFPWFVRNWTFHGYPTILMGETTGYAAYGADYRAMHRFYSLFLVDTTPVFESIARDGEGGVEDALVTPEYVAQAKRLSAQANLCPPSIQAWKVRVRGNTLPASEVNDCHDAIVASFSSLRNDVIRSEGLFFVLSVPVRNVYKAFFKSSLTSQVGGVRDVAVTAIFVARSVVLVAAVALGIVFGGAIVRAAMLFPLTLIAYLSFVTRQVEMRYLAQVDAVSIAIFVVGVASMINWYVLRKSGSRTE